MAKTLKKKRSFLARLRNYFITGIVVLVPIGITLYLTKFFISVSSNLIPKEINPNSYLPFSIPGLEILLSIIFITVIGWLSLSFIGKKILQLVNVFVPTTPNPTSGFLLMFPKKEIIYLDMTFEEASKFIVSAGTSNPKY